MASITGSHGGQCKERVRVNDIAKQLEESYRGTDLGAKLQEAYVLGLTQEPTIPKSNLDSLLYDASNAENKYNGQK